MLRLLGIELHKIKHNKASKILIFIYFGLLTSISLISAIKFDFGPIKFHLAEQGIFNFPFIWHFNIYIADFFKFFLLLVIISMISNEYSYRTLKQNLIDGLSKKEFLLSKFYTAVLFSVISTIFVFVISLILGLNYSDYNEFPIIVTDIDYLIAYFIKLVGFFSFGLFVSILIKRSAFTIASMFIWAIFEGMIKGFLYYKIRNQNTVDNITQFFPLESINNLIKQPFTRLDAVKSVSNQLSVDLSIDYRVNYLTILIAIFWIIIFNYLSYKILKRRDL